MNGTELVNFRNSSHLAASTDPSIRPSTITAAIDPSVTDRRSAVSTSDGTGSVISPAECLWASHRLTPITTAATAVPIANSAIRVTVTFTNMLRRPSESNHRRSVYTVRPNDASPNSTTNPTIIAAHFRNGLMSPGVAAKRSCRGSRSPPLRPNSSAILIPHLSNNPLSLDGRGLG